MILFFITLSLHFRRTWDCVFQVSSGNCVCQSSLWYWHTLGLTPLLEDDFWCVCIYIIYHDSLWECAMHPDLEIRNFYGAPLFSSGNHHFFRKATLTALLHCPYSLTLSSSWYYFIFFTYFFFLFSFLSFPFPSFFFSWPVLFLFFFIHLPKWTQLRKEFQYIILFSIPGSYFIIWLYIT